MRLTFLSPAFLLMFFASQAQLKFQPPHTDQQPVTDTLHSVLFTDPYRWLEDKNDPEVIEWTKSGLELITNFKYAIFSNF